MTFTLRGLVGCHDYYVLHGISGLIIMMEANIAGTAMIGAGHLNWIVINQVQAVQDHSQTT